MLFARRACVGPSFGRTLVAQLVALSVLAQVPELERFAAHAASLELVLLQLVASCAGIGVLGEVSQRPFLSAPCAPRGRGGRRHVRAHRAHQPGSKADAHFVHITGVVAIDTISIGGEHELALLALIRRPKFVPLGVPCLVLCHHSSVFLDGRRGAVV